MLGVARHCVVARGIESVSVFGVSAAVPFWSIRLALLKKEPTDSAVMIETTPIIAQGGTGGPEPARDHQPATSFCYW